MAVVSVEELFPGRRGKDGIERRFESTRVFEVRTDDPLDDEYVAGAADGLPRNGEEHPNNSSLTMRNIDAANSSEDPTLWEVVCEYATDLPSEQAKESGSYDPTSGASVPTEATGDGSGGGDGFLDRADNPLDRPATYRIEREHATEICVLDEFGGQIKNSARLPYDPPAMKEVSYPVICIEKNFPLTHWILDLAVQDEWADAVSSQVWHGIAAGQLRMTDLNVTYGYENGVSFGRVAFKMKLKRSGWTLKLVDAGYQEFIPGSMTPPPADAWRRIRADEETGETDDHPFPLDGNGRKLGAGLDLIYNEYIIYPSKDYNLIEGI